MVSNISLVVGKKVNRKKSQLRFWGRKKSQPEKKSTGKKVNCYLKGRKKSQLILGVGKKSTTSGVGKKVNYYVEGTVC